MINVATKSTGINGYAPPEPVLRNRGRNNKSMNLSNRMKATPRKKGRIINTEEHAKRSPLAILNKIPNDEFDSAINPMISSHLAIYRFPPAVANE